MHDSVISGKYPWTLPPSLSTAKVNPFKNMHSHRLVHKLLTTTHTLLEIANSDTFPGNYITESPLGIGSHTCISMPLNQIKFHMSGPA